MQNKYIPWSNVQSQIGDPTAAMRNAQMGFGAISDLGKSLIDQANKEQAQALAERGMQLNEAANTRAENEVARQQAARAASSQYLTGLGQALDKGVISLADQGRLAAISQDTRLTPKQKQQQIDALLPAMSNSYQKDTGAQLQLLRNVTAPTALDARDQIALLGTATDPLEKRLGRDTEHGYRLAEIEQQRKDQRELAGLQHQYAINTLNKQNEMQRGNDWMMPIDADGTSIRYSEYLKLSPEQQKGYITSKDYDAKVALATANRGYTYGVYDPYMGWQQTTDAKTPGAERIKVEAIGTGGMFSARKSGGSDDSKSSKGGSAGITDALEELPANILWNGRKEASNAAMTASETLRKQGITETAIDRIVGNAISAATVDKFGVGKVFNPTLFKNAIDTGMASATGPTASKYLFRPEVAEKYNQLEASQNLKKAVEQNTQKSTTEATTDSKRTDSYLPSRDDELLRVLRQTTTSSSDPAQRAQLAALEEASKNFVRITDQDKRDLKNLKDELDNTSLGTKRTILQERYNDLKQIVDRGGYDARRVLPSYAQDLELPLVD